MLEHAAGFALDTFALGKWNPEPDEAPIAPCIANGCLTVPQKAYKLAVTKRHAKHRRIDCATCTLDMRVRKRKAIRFKSVHYGIVYDLPGAAITACFALHDKAQLSTDLPVSSGKAEDKDSTRWPKALEANNQDRMAQDFNWFSDAV